MYGDLTEAKVSKELKAAIGRARRAILQAIILATGEDQLSATVSELLKALASRLPYQDGEQ
jgi:hypothetical protein